MAALSYLATSVGFDVFSDGKGQHRGRVKAFFFLALKRLHRRACKKNQIAVIYVFSIKVGFRHR